MYGGRSVRCSSLLSVCRRLRPDYFNRDAVVDTSCCYNLLLFETGRVGFAAGRRSARPGAARG